MKVRFDEARPGELPVLALGLQRVGPFLEEWARLQWTGPGPAPDIATTRITLPELLAMAYLQGVRDAAEVTCRAGWTPPENCA